MDWQKIDTAPKNDVIVLTDGGALWQGFWTEGLGWITGFDDGCIHIRVSVNPTHWAPLPTPPGVPAKPLERASDPIPDFLKRQP